MKSNIVILAMLAAGCVGAYWQLTKNAPALAELMARPESIPDSSTAGVGEIEAGPELAEHCELGCVTVFVFYSDSCPASSRLREHIGRFSEIRRDVAFRMIDLGGRWGGGDYEAIYGVKIRSMPHVMIYDAEAHLVAGDEGRDKDGLELLYDWMNAEIEREYDESYAEAG